LNRSLDARFAAQAGLTPDAVALRRGSRSITYAALEARAARVAGALTERGIGPGAVVGLHLERSIDQVSAMLGILASGAAVMPLPPSFPEGRKRDILRLAESPLVIDAGTSTLSSEFAGGLGRCQVLTLERLLDDGGS
jgi:non-ribosomal peptide synthetase component F